MKTRVTVLSLMLVGLLASNASAAFISIHDIQFTTDGLGDSPHDGTIGVETEGIVTLTIDGGYWLEQPGGGAWNGIFVFDPVNFASAAVGDQIGITGTVQEFYNMTEMSSITAFSVITSGNAIPGPQSLATGSVSVEQWEGVRVRVNNVTVTDPDIGFGEWLVSDGSGDVVIDDKGTYTYVPVLNDFLESVTGPLDYNFGAFKIQPGDDSDIVPEPATISLLVLGGLLVYRRRR